MPSVTASGEESAIPRNAGSASQSQEASAESASRRTSWSPLAPQWPLLLEPPTKAVKRAVKMALAGIGLSVTRTGPRPFVEFRDYIPCAPTIEAARRAGQSVGDYIDRTYSQAGITAETIEQMRSAGVLDHARRICEIGPGSGRYLERVMKICAPERYEIYETATDWRAYLERTYSHVVSRSTDGRTLAETATGSVDLVHAHKVFCGLPTMVALSYLREMARVVAPGGAIVFDTLTERLLDSKQVDAWLSSTASYDTYPAMLPRQYVVDRMHEYGFGLTKSFDVAISPGASECFVFRRQAARWSS
jgi:phospholipid N-methyltransferase